MMIVGRTQHFMCPRTNQPHCMENKLKLHFVHFLLVLALIFNRFNKCGASQTSHQQMLMKQLLDLAARMLNCDSKGQLPGIGMSVPSSCAPTTTWPHSKGCL